MRSGLKEAELLFRCDGGGFGYRCRTTGTCVMGHWVDGSEPEGSRIEGSDILCSCRPETWQCRCGLFQYVFWKNWDGQRAGADMEDLIEGQKCRCGREFDEGSWACASSID
jgi:hypothetical protein